MQLLCMNMLLVSGCIHRLYAAALYATVIYAHAAGLYAAGLYAHAASLRLYTQAVMQLLCVQLFCMRMLLASGCMQMLCMQLARMHMLLALYAHAAGLRLYTQAVCSSSVCTCCWPVCSPAVGAALACMQLLICMPISGSQHQTSHCKIATDKCILTCTPAPRWGSLQHP